LSSEDDAAINSAVEHMYTQYPNFEAIFD